MTFTHFKCDLSVQILFGCCIEQMSFNRIVAFYKSVGKIVFFDIYFLHLTVYNQITKQTHYYYYYYKLIKTLGIDCWPLNPK